MRPWIQQSPTCSDTQLEPILPPPSADAVLRHGRMSKNLEFFLSLPSLKASSMALVSTSKNFINFLTGFFRIQKAQMSVSPPSARWGSWLSTSARTISVRSSCSSNYYLLRLQLFKTAWTPMTKRVPVSSLTYSRPSSFLRRRSSANISRTSCNSFCNAELIEITMMNWGSWLLTRYFGRSNSEWATRIPPRLLLTLTIVSM